MLHKLMQTMMGSCKQATYDISRKEEGVLGLPRQARLWLHLRFCEYCRKFEKQSSAVKNATKSITGTGSLSSESKQKLKDSLNNDSQ